jgi:tetratricopeptide (TPR) repeat protein
MGKFSQYMAEANLEYTIKNKKFKSAINYLSKAYSVFPDDIWPLYWLAYSEAELKHYSQALFYFQLLFESDLSSFIETLPVVYKKAAYCANKIGNDRLAKEYLNTSEKLYNEFGVRHSGYDMDYIVDR